MCEPCQRMNLCRLNSGGWLGCWLILLTLGPVRPAGAAGPELIAKVSGLAAAAGTNELPRRMVQVDLSGTVLVGGDEGGVANLDGSPALYRIGPPATGVWRRGERIQLTGEALATGTNLELEAWSLIDNDGLHSMVERRAGLWLERGYAPIQVEYFNLGGERGLELTIAGPGMPLAKISDDQLFHPVTNALGGVSWERGLRFRCYEGAWEVLPGFAVLPVVMTGMASNFDIAVAGRQDNFGLVFEGAVSIPHGGFYVLGCASDDGSRVKVGTPHLSIRSLGRTVLSPVPRLAAGQLVSGDTNSFCAAVEGTVTFAVREAGAVRLELSSGRGKAQVRLFSDGLVDPQWLVGARVVVTGICQSVFAAEGYPVAGELTAYGDGNLQVLDVPGRLWSDPTAFTNAVAGLDGVTNRGRRLVRWQGNLAQRDGELAVTNPAGAVILSAGDALGLEPGSMVEALGMPGRFEGQPALRYYALRQLSAAGGSPGLPVLTTVEEIKQMSRDKAKLGYPVKVRGVITFVWPNAGFFLQDGTWSIDVRLATNGPALDPQIGEYWRVEGQTFADFAPDILALRAERLGAGAMPDPEHPSWTQLVDGSMDTQYIEVQGVVLSVDGTALNLLTRSGRIRVQLPEVGDGLLNHFLGALVRVRGCVIPGRDTSTQQVKLGEFVLRNASVAVDEPAPADPFDRPQKHATDLLMFDAHASPIERARIGGVVLQQREGFVFLMDGSNGVRVVSEAPIQLRPGDQIEAVGFPDLTGPSPVFNDAAVRRVGQAGLPAPIPLRPDHLLDGHYDAMRVTVEGTLVSQRDGEAEQLLEMHSGVHSWLTRLPVRAGVRLAVPVGSVLKLTGVYAGQGGDRMRGREIDSFEMLLNSPADVEVLSTPSWWTARRALAVAGGLLAILLLAAVWIRALHRQVDERTRALKSEIEDHKRTELELERKTELLTREIDERRRIEAEVERGHKQLLVTSRLAGMAEVATSVLHNVGNVMTSVNVLSTSIVDLVRNSKVASVARLGELLRQQRHEMDRFVTQDERGRKMPDYVGQLGAHLADEQALLLQKVKVLNQNIQHINEIVSMQQDFAKVSGVFETLPPVEVVEDALRMHGESLKRHGIKLVREFAPIPAVTMDRHKVLQILFNLLENAKYACLQGRVQPKEISVRLQPSGTGFVRLAVADNGMGIAPENLSRIFGQGFSTRKDGHGFGLHSSVLAAQDMGGSLTARSDGPDRGAEFVLEIPLQPHRAVKPPK